MSIAFLQFSDPYSWLIRGFVEANWQDLSLSSGQILPQKTGAGFDLRFFVQSNGRFGIRLYIMAIDHDDQWFHQDQMYVFDVVFGQDNIGQPAYLVTSKDTGYSEFFPFSEYNPLMSVEQLIERVHKRHVPQFVEERKNGKVVSAHDINGMFTTRPAMANPNLLQCIFQRNQMGLSFDSAISEGLWYPNNNNGIFSQQNVGFSQQNQYAPPPVQRLDPAQNQEIQQQIPNQAPPVIQSGITAGDGKGAIFSEGNVVGDIRAQAIELLETPAQALQIFSFIGMVFGGAEFINTVLIFMKISSGNMVIPDKSYYFMLFAMHFLISIFCIAGGIVSYLFNKEYRQIGSPIKASIAMIYPSLIPICCITGIPISVWAFLTWNKPQIQELRK